MMWIRMRAKGVGRAPPIFFYQNGTIVPKFIVMNVKINNFKDNFPQILKIIRYFSHQYQHS